MMTNILLFLCGIFYAILCVFSIVTGLMYASGKKELNPLELSDAFMSRYASPEKRKRVSAGASAADGRRPDHAGRTWKRR